MTTTAVVIRSGQRQSLSASHIVPGDIVVLQAGDRVPADLRLISGKEIQVAEAALTGGSSPVKKDSGGVLPVDQLLAERVTMVYASTLLVSGQALGVVTASGDATELGRISKLISSAQTLETSLNRKIAVFSRTILLAFFSLATLPFVIGLLRGQMVTETFIAAVALTVA
jgi:Ca2+-transporting ATPase